MEEIEQLKERVLKLEKELENLSIQFQLFKLKYKTTYDYPNVVADNPYFYNKRDFT